MKTPVMLPDKLDPRDPGECSLCGKTTARWTLTLGDAADSICSLCYLYEETSVGDSEEFRELCAEVRKRRTLEVGEKLRLCRIEDADVMLATLVLTNRMFSMGDERRG